MAEITPTRWPNIDPKSVSPEVFQSFKLIFNAVEDHRQAFAALSQQGSLHATVSGGAITAVNVLNAGVYTSTPTVTAVGGGGTGATLQAKLNRDGGIQSVTIVKGGTGYTSAPALTISGGQ